MPVVSYSRQLLQQEAQYDVIVVGGGSAGICAAIASARQGARTLLVENTGWLGGIGTTAAMVEFGPVCRAGRRVLGGIPYELMQRMHAFGGAEWKDETKGMYYAPETFAHVAMELCAQAGVELLLHTRFIDALRNETRITGLVVDNKQGTYVLQAKMYIDCTGDGDVFFKAGLPFSLGRDQDGATQPMTLVFFVNDVDYAAFQQAVKHEAQGDPDRYFMPLIQKAAAEGRFSIPIVRPGSVGPVPRYGRPHNPHCCEVFINGTNVLHANGTHATHLTKAEQTTRRQVYEMFRFLRSDVPGFEQCYLSHVPAEIGVRETRRLQGAYTLTQQDLLQAARFPDAVAIGFNMIDIHQVAGHDFDLTHMQPGTYYDIPYKTLYTPRMENLLVAGRCISVTHEALGAVRVMVNTMPVGQAAGTAAALAARQGYTVQNIPVETLRSHLEKAGALLAPCPASE